MEYDGCVSQIQHYLENSPLVILGSGASISYGLPSMFDLSEEVGRHSVDFDSEEFNAFCLNLSTMNLEDALDASILSPIEQTRIREIAWEYINNHDSDFFNKLIANQNNFAMCELLKKIMQPAQNTTTVVTTNYDRVVEYAADIIGAIVVTGFEGIYIKNLEFPSGKLSSQRIRARERTVFIWKVHGSLDWFIVTVQSGKEINKKPKANS